MFIPGEATRFPYEQWWDVFPLEETWQQRVVHDGELLCHAQRGRAKAE